MLEFLCVYLVDIIFHESEFVILLFVVVSFLLLFDHSFVYGACVFVKTYTYFYNLPVGCHIRFCISIVIDLT